MHLYIWTECRDASFIIPTALNPYQYTFCTTSPACTYNILPLESILLWKRAHYRLSIQPHFRLLRSKTSKSAQATICRAISAPPLPPILQGDVHCLWALFYEVFFPFFGFLRSPMYILCWVMQYDISMNYNVKSAHWPSNYYTCT